MTRIIGGEWKGHPLPNLKHGSVRPTTDRARTVLFDTLRDVNGAHVLDLYSGTGALGFEAMSRGAVSLMSIEMNGRYVQEQKRWASLHQVEPVFVRGKVEKELKHLEKTFDLIFADPPYAEGLSAEVQILIEGLLTKSGRFVFETARRNSVQLEFHSMELVKEKVVAETKLLIYKAN